MVPATSSPRRLPAAADATSTDQAPTECKLNKLPEASTDQLDLYVKEGWREALCSCNGCCEMYYLRDLSFLREAEELYEPPLDDEAGESLDDVALKQLKSMPRDRAIEAVNAYNRAKEELQEFFALAAAKGKVITEKDVREFFEVGHMEAPRI